MSWSSGSCAAGVCHPTGERASVRCGRHAARWARTVMEQQGLVCITEYGASATPSTDNWIMMVNAIHASGLEMQHWLAGWDESRGLPLYGVWAPRVAAVILAMAEDALDERQLVAALTASKHDPDFCQAVDAAWRLGGKAAAHDVIITKLPYVTRKPRKR